MRKTTRWLALVLGLALLGGALVLALVGGRDAPPPRVWTREPPPSEVRIAATPTEGLWTAPGGAPVRGWDAFWRARFGPKGTTDLDWELALIPSVTVVDRIRERLSGDHLEPAPLEFAESGATVRVGEVTWQEWTRRRPPLEDGR